MEALLRSVMSVLGFATNETYKRAVGLGNKIYLYLLATFFTVAIVPIMIAVGLNLAEHAQWNFGFGLIVAAIIFIMGAQPRMDILIWFLGAVNAKLGGKSVINALSEGGWEFLAQYWKLLRNVLIWELLFIGLLGLFPLKHVGVSGFIAVVFLILFISLTASAKWVNWGESHLGKKMAVWIAVIALVVTLGVIIIGPPTLQSWGIDIASSSQSDKLLTKKYELAQLDAQRRAEAAIRCTAPYEKILQSRALTDTERKLMNACGETAISSAGPPSHFGVWGAGIPTSVAGVDLNMGMLALIGIAVLVLILYFAQRKKGESGKETGVASGGKATAKSSSKGDDKSFRNSIIALLILGGLYWFFTTYGKATPEVPTLPPSVAAKKAFFNAAQESGKVWVKVVVPVDRNTFFGPLPKAYMIVWSFNGARPMLDSGADAGNTYLFKTGDEMALVGKKSEFNDIAIRECKKEHASEDECDTTWFQAPLGGLGGKAKLFRANGERYATIWSPHDPRDSITFQFVPVMK